MSTQPVYRQKMINGSFASHRRITARPRRKSERWELQHLFRTLVDPLDAVIWEGDEESSQRTFVDPQSGRLLGYSEEQWTADPTFWESRIHPADHERVFRHRARALSEGRDYEIEYRMLAPDGGVIWLRDRVLVLTENGRPYKLLGLTENITRYRRGENLSREETKHNSVQIMDGVRSLAGTMAHDFNNLLTVINGYSDLILERLGDSDPLRRDLQAIRDAGERASALTQRLLILSSRKIPLLKTLDLNSLILGMEKALRNSMGESINVVLNLNTKPCRIKADPKQMEQVVAILAANARDAMPRGGVLIIETENVEVNGESAVENPGLRSGIYVVMAVQDSGCGMDENVKAHLYEPFYTTKEKGGGIGLGLATVFGIVERAGGHIEVSSEPDLGTTFRIFLPMADDMAESGISQRSPHRKNETIETILLAEDEEFIRRLSHKILNMRGYNVLEAADGIEALSIFQENQDCISMLLTDMVMPKMNGEELARKVCSIRPDAKICYLSGYVDDVAVHQAVAENRAFFLQKPFTADELLKKVREILDG